MVEGLFKQGHIAAQAAGQGGTLCRPVWQQAQQLVGCPASGGQEWDLITRRLSRTGTPGAGGAAGWPKHQWVTALQQGHSLSTSSQEADSQHTAEGQGGLPTVLEYVVKLQWNQERCSVQQAGSLDSLGGHEAAKQDISTERDQMPHVSFELLTWVKKTQISCILI